MPELVFYRKPLEKGIKRCYCFLCRLAKDEVYESDSDDLLLHEAHSSHIIKGQPKDKCG